LGNDAYIALLALTGLVIVVRTLMLTRPDVPKMAPLWCIAGRRHKDINMIRKNFLQAMDDGYIPPMMNRFDIATMTVHSCLTQGLLGEAFANSRLLGLQCPSIK
jgi:hypothetical protein